MPTTQVVFRVTTRRIIPSAFRSLVLFRLIIYSTSSSCIAVPAQPMGMNTSGRFPSAGITNPKPFLLAL